MFGDDREDYAAALQRHYAEGAPPDWQDNFVSTYATTHAWEDFAETWAHYLHIVDSLETASVFGLAVHPAIATDEVGMEPRVPGAKVRFRPSRAVPVIAVVPRELVVAETILAVRVVEELVPIVEAVGESARASRVEIVAEP